MGRLQPLTAVFQWPTLEALLLCVLTDVVLVIRPARPDDGGVFSSAGEDVLKSTLLPRRCGPDGLIMLEAGGTYRTEVGNHQIDASCRELRGAPDARILLLGGLVLESLDAVIIQGPLTMMMAPGLANLSAPAVQSSGNLQLVSPEGSLLEFRNIRSSGCGAAVAADGNIDLAGQGGMLFENLHTAIDGAAVFSKQVISITVPDLRFKNCSASSAGGAVHSFKGVHLSTNGSVLFDTCSSGYRGGAIGSRALVTLSGMGRYIFQQCSSSGKLLGGGAVSAMGGVVMELSAGGSAEFRQCRATSLERGGSGGAIYSHRNINITSGLLKFHSCHAGTGNGNAMTAAHGAVRIAVGAQVELEAMKDFVGSVIFARTAVLRVDGNIAPGDVFAQIVLAAKPENHTNRCPVGSMLLLDEEFRPIHDKCVMCGSGSASLAPAFMRIKNQVATPEAGMRLVLVRRTSPNVFTSLGASIVNKSASHQDTTCAEDLRCLGIAKGGSGSYLDSHAKAQLGRLAIWGTEDKVTFTFERGQLRTLSGDFLDVPSDVFAPGIPLLLIPEGDEARQHSTNGSAMFRMDEHGVVSPVRAADLALGIDHEVTYAFQPRNPHEACMPCHWLASEQADKIQCDGGSRVQSIVGYMILHKEGSPQIDVHRCPNRAACPGSKLRLTVEGQLSDQSVLCADGYLRSPGCVACAPGYGRPQLEPFICQACGSASWVQQVGTAMVSSGLFYAIALSSARPRRETQQIFKVFLAYLTISCRSISAVPHTPHFQQLKQDLYAYVHAFARWLFAVDVVMIIEPGSGVDSFDCWGVGPVDASSSLGLSWSVPLALLLCSFCWLGARAWLQVLVVWGNVFIPPLVGAAARLVPCFSTQEGRHRILMYEAASETRCASDVSGMMRLPRFWLALGTVALLALLGPVLWLSLSLAAPNPKRKEERDQTVGFLVSGYRSSLRWWEVTVLTRKAAIFVVSAWFPMSFAPGAHCSYLLLIVVVAELMHSTIRPYTSSFLNRLEAQTLGISSVSVLLVISMLVDWPFKPYTAYVSSCALLVVLTVSVYLYFFCLYIIAMLSSQEGTVAEEAEDGADTSPSPGRSS